MNKKTSQKQALPLKSQQKNKQLGSTPCKILRTVLKMKKERTQIKKVDDDAQDIKSKR